MSNQLLRNTLILSLAILLTAAGSTVAQQRRPSSNAYSQQQAASESATGVFRSARDLITDGEWARAQDKFNEYVTKYPNEKNLDAALYWLAYSQHKLAKYDQCRQTINKLFAKYQNSSWLDDARLLMAQIPGAFVTDPVVALRVDEMIAAAKAIDDVLVQAKAITPGPAAARGVDLINPAGTLIDPAGTLIDPAGTLIDPAGASLTAITPGVPVPGQLIGVANVDWLAPNADWNGILDNANDDDPCEFKIVVLQALFQTDVQRGILAATEWLKPGSTQTVRCKSAALTLLARHGGKTVTPVLLTMAKNEADVRLRARAISTLGATNDDSVIEPLREFALNSTDTEIAEASLYALSRHTNDRVIGVLTEIAASAKTPEQRKTAIMSIASRPGDAAVDALFRIYDANQSVEIRKTVINGFANRKSERAGEKLFDIARTSDNLELRKAAVSNIPRRGGDKAIDFLISLYDTEKNDELKDQILNAFGSGTTWWPRAPKVVGAPGPAKGVGGPSPDLYVRSVGQNLYGSRSPEAEKKVTRKLIDIARNPQESMARRKRAIGWLSRSEDPDVQKFLEELLRQ
jgi:hypothetical protein